VIAAADEHPNAFTAHHEELLLGVGRQVAVAFEAALARQRERSEAAQCAAILEQLPCAVLVLEPGGRVIVANDAARRIGGVLPDRTRPLQEQVDVYRSREPLTGRRLRPDETLAARVLAGEHVESYEHLIERPGEAAPVWLHSSGVPLYDERGHLTAAVMVFSDVTRERELMRDLSATAVQHARLLGEMTERRRQLQPSVRQPQPAPAGRIAGTSRPATLERLTRREYDVLHLLAKGKSNREIAVALNVSAGTVKTHVEHIIAKLGVADRTQAALRAIALGLIHGPLDVS
jgi:DNA-binding CsgD family transcriptional regulator